MLQSLSQRKRRATARHSRGQVGTCVTSSSCCALRDDVWLHAVAVKSPHASSRFVLRCQRTRGDDARWCAGCDTRAHARDVPPRQALHRQQQRRGKAIRQAAATWPWPGACAATARFLRGAGEAAQAPERGVRKRPRTHAAARARSGSHLERAKARAGTSQQSVPVHTVTVEAVREPAARRGTRTSGRSFQSASPVQAAAVAGPGRADSPGRCRSAASWLRRRTGVDLAT